MGPFLVLHRRILSSLMFKYLNLYLGRQLLCATYVSNAFEGIVASLQGSMSTVSCMGCQKNTLMMLFFGLICRVRGAKYSSTVFLKLLYFQAGLRQDWNGESIVLLLLLALSDLKLTGIPEKMVSPFGFKP